MYVYIKENIGMMILLLCLWVEGCHAKGEEESVSL